MTTVDKLSGADIRALLTTSLIVCGVLLLVLINALSGWVHRQHEWRMTQRTVNTDDDSTQAGNLTVVRPGQPFERMPQPPRPRPIKDDPQG